MRAYTATLRGTMRFRWLTVAAGLGFFAVALWGTQFLPSGFMPQENLSRLMISAELPPGTPLEGTLKATDQAVKNIRQIPEVKSVYVVGGASPTGTLERRRATIVINLLHKSERTRTQKDLEPVILAAIAKVPDLRANFVNDRGAPEIELGIMGDDGKAVANAARQIQTQMRQTGDFLGVTSNAALERPEIVVRPRTDKLADLGLTTVDISQAVRVATIGDVDSNLAKFPVGDRQIPIRVELTKKARENLNAIENLSIRTPSGTAVPLVSVADIQFTNGPTAISRYNRERRVVIGASMIKGKEIGDGLNTVMGLDAVKNLPAGVRVQETGDAEVMGEIFTSFRDAMITGLLLVLVVLILLFGSVFHAFTILASLPLSIGGVVLGLYLTNNSVSMPVVIGILMLMGIVTKNAIMLVDFAVEEQKQGLSKEEAMIDAGRKRARPIVMTTIAMAAGMLPAALAYGDGGEFRAPMAIAVIGGLLVSTVLSLVFVPSFYSIMDSVTNWMSRFFHWLFAFNEPDDPELEAVRAEKAHERRHPDNTDMPVAAE
jgi:multidrug efflux pump subunit AcrB